MFQDPREALIVALKREVSILTQENNHLRQLVELASDGSGSVGGVEGGYSGNGGGGGHAGGDLQQMMVAGYGHYVDGRGKTFYFCRCTQHYSFCLINNHKH